MDNKIDRIIEWITARLLFMSTGTFLFTLAFLFGVWYALDFLFTLAGY